METQKVLIGPPSTSFALLNLASLAILYTKLEKGLYVKWWVVMFPTNMFFVYSLGKVLYFIARAQGSKAFSNYSSSKLLMVWKFTQILMLSSLIAMAIFTANYLQKIDDAESPEDITDSMKHIFAAAAVLFVTYLGYSTACRVILKDEEDFLKFDLEDDQSDSRNSKVTLKRTIVNGVLSVMGNTMSVCAGGSCNSIYMSTISAFFSAFGIPIVEYIHYLNFIAFFFVGLSLVSLYSVNNTVKYPPFIITAIGSAFILADIIFAFHDYFTYAGNVLLIGGAIWNSRLNKFSIVTHRKKQKLLNSV